ncbi:MAG: hypothetical protein IJ327_04160 [Lachnospiraceae bacterium]|nr:hypothetical protein [Lachnospiraceae bacterium]
MAFPALDGTLPAESCIEEISLFTFGSRRLKGSMTVEAAVLLPLLIFFLLNLGSIMELIRLHGNIELALTNVGNELSVYQYVVSAELSRGEQQELPDVLKPLLQEVISRVYIRHRVETYLGKEYLENAPLKDCENRPIGIGWNIVEEGDRLELRYSYGVKCPFKVPGFPDFYMSNNYYSHVWTGYEIPGSLEGVGLETVFLAEYGEVYHLSMDCTHLKLSVRELSMWAARRSTNKRGCRYELCEHCKGLIPGNVVYVTDYGACFHYSRQCEGLRRTIYSSTLAEAKGYGYQLCSRCGKE